MIDISTNIFYSQASIFNAMWKIEPFHFDRKYFMRIEQENNNVQLLLSGSLFVHTFTPATIHS